MVRILLSRIIDGSTNYIEGACLALDDKPTAGICTGSKMTEADTGDVYLFDEVGKTWTKVAAGYVAPAEGGGE